MLRLNHKKVCKVTKLSRWIYSVTQTLQLTSKSSLGLHCAFLNNFHSRYMQKKKFLKKIKHENLILVDTKTTTLS